MTSQTFEFIFLLHHGLCMKTGEWSIFWPLCCLYSQTLRLCATLYSVPFLKGLLKDYQSEANSELIFFLKKKRLRRSNHKDGISGWPKAIENTDWFHQHLVVVLTWSFSSCLYSHICTVLHLQFWRSFDVKNQTLKICEIELRFHRIVLIKM